MSVPAQKFREAVFQLLYSYDVGRGDEDDMVDLIMHELAITKKVTKEALSRVEKILKKLSEIDAMIGKTSQSYTFERIQSVERNVLRLGLYELLFDDEIPPKVALAEAMRMTRKFGTKESASFVNAILDALYKQSLGEPVDIKQVSLSAAELSKSEQIALEAALNPPQKPELDDE
ncbi:MAG: transcription antitermination factor NusB [Parachlamydiaceae bacterium]|nr:transcription antitermination factor NusB [Parachlamydiaceae bacterium]